MPVPAIHKAIPVEAHRDYLFPLADYIHLNPARAGMIAKGVDVVEYRWSSLPVYADAAPRPEWLECGCILGEMGVTDAPSTGQAYVAHVEGRRGEPGPGIGLEDVPPDEGAWFVGSKGFCHRFAIVSARTLGDQFPARPLRLFQPLKQLQPKTFAAHKPRPFIRRHIF